MLNFQVACAQKFQSELLLYSTCLFISNLSVRVESETFTVRAVMGATYIYRLIYTGSIARTSHLGLVSI